MRKIRPFLLALAVLIPAAAQAQWSVGARAGYAIPLGDADGSAKMTDITSGLVPLQLDVGYRLQNTQLTVGGYFSYGFAGSAAGATKDLCNLAGESCSTSSLRVGAQLLYSFADAKAPADPWLGVGIGYESLTLKATNDLTLSGTEFLNLQGGYDWRFGTGALGLFASFSLGQYSDIKVSGGGPSGTISDKKMHEWFTVGVRGSLGFGS